MATPPKKPFPTFPLFAHQSGQWSKKIRGKHVYFGVWADPDAAHAKYLQERDYLQAGQLPPENEKTVADLLNAFILRKESLRDTGDITPRTYDEYEAVCDVLAATLHKHRAIKTIDSDALSAVRNVLAKGKNGKSISPVSHKRLLSIARMVFNFANEELGQAVRYKAALQSPSARRIRESRNQVGKKLFTADEVRSLVKSSGTQLRAMILLGINCGFGNGDCGTLVIEKVDLKNGWHHYHRPKTQVERRAPLWPETIEALEAVIQDRTEGLVFTTKYGNPWTSDGRQDPIAFEFRKTARHLGIYRDKITTFYTLRRTFETIACTGSVPQFVIDLIMGHVADARDMAAVYRQSVDDQLLIKCVNHVRQWYLGEPATSVESTSTHSTKR